MTAPVLVYQVQGRLCGHTTCAVAHGGTFGRTPHLVEYSMVAFLKFIIIFESETPLLFCAGCPSVCVLTRR